MVKTLLKSALIVIVLAGIFFAALQLYENQKKRAPQTTESAPTPAPVAAIALNKLEVLPAGDGAMIQLSDVAATYRMSPAPDGKSLNIEMFGSQISLAQKSWTSPHPLIASIDTAETLVAGAKAAAVKVIFTKEVDVRDQFAGKTLVINLVAKAAPTPTPAPTVAPVAKKVVKKAKPAVKAPVTKVKKEPKKKAPKHTAKPKPAPVDDLLPPPPPPSETMEAPADLPPPPEEAPPAAHADEPKAPSASPGNLDLDKLFAESQAESVPSEPPPADEPPSAEPTPAKVAALPPSSGTFDKSKIARDLPKIIDIAVQGGSGPTVVTIARDGKAQHKFFRQRNPSRIVVEVRNARNALQAEYPGFVGTKITKITTQEFVGDEVKTRITLFVKGEPQFDSSSKTNALVVTIP